MKRQITDSISENLTDSDLESISVRKSYNSMGSQTISHWIKSMLKKSGIDINIFTAYSTRHASVSSAFKSGVDISTIRRTAGWTSTSQTFARFYNKPTQESSNTFGLSVLKHAEK